MKILDFDKRQESETVKCASKDEQFAHRKIFLDPVNPLQFWIAITLFR